jgi:hypothetical protein
MKPSGEGYTEGGLQRLCLEGLVVEGVEASAFFLRDDPAFEEEEDHRRSPFLFLRLPGEGSMVDF